MRRNVRRLNREVAEFATSLPPPPPADSSSTSSKRSRSRGSDNFPSSGLSAQQQQRHTMAPDTLEPDLPFPAAAAASTSGSDSSNRSRSGSSCSFNDTNTITASMLTTLLQKQQGQQNHQQEINMRGVMERELGKGELSNSLVTDPNIMAAAMAAIASATAGANGYSSTTTTTSDRKHAAMAIGEGGNNSCSSSRSSSSRKKGNGRCRKAANLAELQRYMTAAADAANEVLKEAGGGERWNVSDCRCPRWP